MKVEKCKNSKVVKCGKFINFIFLLPYNILRLDKMRIPRKPSILGTLAAFIANALGCAPTELQVDLPASANPTPYYFTDEEGNRAPRFLDDYAIITLDFNGDGSWDKIVWGFDQDNDRKIKERELYDVRFGSTLRGIYPVRLPKPEEKELEYPEGTLPGPATSATPTIEIPAKDRRERISSFLGSVESLEARIPEVIFSTGDSTLDVILSRRFHSFAQRLFMAAFDYNKEGQDKIGVYVAIAGRGVYPVVFDDIKMEFKVGEPLSIERMQEVEKERQKRYLLALPSENTSGIVPGTSLSPPGVEEKPKEKAEPAPKTEEKPAEETPEEQ